MVPGRLHLKGIDNVSIKHEVEAPSGVEGTRALAWSVQKVGVECSNLGSAQC